LKEVISFLLDGGFRFITMAGEDERSAKNRFTISYIFGFPKENRFISLVLSVDPANPVFPSVADVLLSARLFGLEIMDMFGLNKHKAYKIANPLSDEWVYMRPTLLPGILAAIKENLKHEHSLQLFELGMTYGYRQHDLPKETPVLMVAWTGNRLREAKGLARLSSGGNG